MTGIDPVTPERPAVVPPVLYLPLTRTSTPSKQSVEIRQLKDGRRALLAYTALDRLTACAGEKQPWTLLRTEDLAQIEEQQPFDIVVFDLEIPQRYRREGAIA